MTTNRYTLLGYNKQNGTVHYRDFAVIDNNDGMELDYAGLTDLVSDYCSDTDTAERDECTKEIIDIIASGTTDSIPEIIYEYFKKSEDPVEVYQSMPIKPPCDNTQYFID